MKATLLHTGTDHTGEAATWLADSETFLWVDIEGKLLHEYVPATGQYTDHPMPDMVSTIIPFRADEVILALQGHLVRYQLKTKKLLELTPFEAGKSTIRPNDGKASPDGRLFLGTMHLTNQQSTGVLYRIDHDLSIRPVLTNQCIPNGIVWDKTGTRMYYNDSGRGVIEAYAYDMATGELTFLRTAVKVPPAYGVADGMTIDANGLLWAAHWGGAGVYVWNPETGVLVDKVDVPALNVASCTFGGKDGKQLFITTARTGLSAAKLAEYPLSGSLFVADVSVSPGINHYPFYLY